MREPSILFWVFESIIGSSILRQLTCDRVGAVSSPLASFGINDLFIPYITYSLALHTKMLNYLVN